MVDQEYLKNHRIDVSEEHHFEKKKLKLFEGAQGGDIIENQFGEYARIIDFGFLSTGAYAICQVIEYIPQLGKWHLSKDTFHLSEKVFEFEGWRVWGDFESFKKNILNEGE